MWRAAHFYARRGLHVFPLAPRSKRPLLRAGNGYLDASTDAAVIDTHWSSCPVANVGIACAPSGLIVVDVDSYRGGDDALAAFEREHGATPRSWEALARGRHVYLRAPADARVRGHLTSIDCGVEIKHQGYVVAPPSIHPSGITYVWDVGAHPIDGATIAEIPPRWLKALAKRSTTSASVAVGAARETFFGAAFAACGWLGRDVPSGAACARCPWASKHTDQRGWGMDSSSVILPASTDLRIGRFFCSHAHCTGRTNADVIGALPREAVNAASREYPTEFRVVVMLRARRALDIGRAP
jgi:hypothetical protein